MKKAFAVFCLSVLFFSCQTQNSVGTAITDDELWAVIAPRIVDGAEVSDIRPAPDMLSEKEMLIKCAKIASVEGYLDSNNLIYTEDQPKLLTARIEAPILVYNFSAPAENIRYGTYLLVAVDDNGEALLDVRVDPLEYDSSDSHGAVRITNTLASSELSRHYITEREARALIESQFPGQEYEGPAAVRMQFADDLYGWTSVSWYFTVGDSASRSVAGGEYREYLINALIAGYQDLPVADVTAPTNRSAIDSRRSLPGFTFTSRMALLTEPVYFFDKLKAIREGQSLAAPVVPRSAPARVIPVPLQ
jgi:hypothetical protein